MGLFTKRPRRREPVDPALESYRWATRELKDAWLAFHAAEDSLTQDEATYRIKAAECRLEAARRQLREAGVQAPPDEGAFG